MDTCGVEAKETLAGGELCRAGIFGRVWFLGCSADRGSGARNLAGKKQRPVPVAALPDEGTRVAFFGGFAQQFVIDRQRISALPKRFGRDRRGNRGLRASVHRAL